MILYIILCVTHLKVNKEPLEGSEALILERLDTVLIHFTSSIRLLTLFNADVHVQMCCVSFIPPRQTCAFNIIDITLPFWATLSLLFSL